MYNLAYSNIQHSFWTSDIGILIVYTKKEMAISLQLLAWTGVLNAFWKWQYEP